MSITLFLDTEPSTVIPLNARGHNVHLSAASCLDGTVVVADCICGVHAEPFTTQREVFEFLRGHKEGLRAL
jgi:hypothetical protein